jgi:hypothetical protein
MVPSASKCTPVEVEVEVVVGDMFLGPAERGRESGSRVPVPILSMGSAACSESSC